MSYCAHANEEIWLLMLDPKLYTALNVAAIHMPLSYAISPKPYAISFKPYTISPKPYALNHMIPLYSEEWPLKNESLSTVATHRTLSRLTA